MAIESPRPFFALAAATLLTGSLGSIHAFSVFIAPLEAIYGTSRESVSLVYSFALLSLTVAVLGSHRIFRLSNPAVLVLAVGFCAAGGLILPLWIDGLLSVQIGYGVIFGFSNGLGYALALQLAARAIPAKASTAMGAITAVYALGAMLFAQLFHRVIADGGFEGALTLIAIVMLLVGLVGAVAAGMSRVTLAPAGQARLPASATGSGKLTGLLWLGYGSGCLAGLMAIGHAAGIVQSVGGRGAYLTTGVTLIAVGNAVGGFGAGYLADRFSVRGLLAAFSLVSAAALMALAFTGDPLLVLLWLTAIGVCYGAIIALYPAVTLTYFGVQRMAKVYGRVFTAWGLAGLVGPWIAGWLYDQNSSYGLAVILAACAAVVSAATSLFLPRPSPREHLED